MRIQKPQSSATRACARRSSAPSHDTSIFYASPQTFGLTASICADDVLHMFNTTTFATFVPCKPLHNPSQNLQVHKWKAVEGVLTRMIYVSLDTSHKRWACEGRDTRSSTRDVLQSWQPDLRRQLSRQGLGHSTQCSRIKIEPKLRGIDQ